MAIHYVRFMTNRKAFFHGMRCSRAWCGTPPILGAVNIPFALMHF